MSHLPNIQREEYAHRKGNEFFPLHKINAEMVYYLYENKKLEKICSAIPNYKDRLFRALGANDHRIRLAYGKELMRDLWESELGLGGYPFADVLAEFEFGSQFYKGYRDHVLHQLRVYLLGLYLFYGCKKIRNLIMTYYEHSKTLKITSEKEFLLLWKITSLSHDHGYIFEVPEAETNQWVINKVLPTFDHRVGFPLSSLADSIRHNGFSHLGSGLLSSLYHLLRSRAISHTKEQELQSMLEMSTLSVRTVNDLLLYRGKSLLDLIDSNVQQTNLSNKGTNCLKAYYDFAFQYRSSNKRPTFRDHGITSALFLLLQNEYNTYYAGKLKNINHTHSIKKILPEENITFIEGICKLFKNSAKYVIAAASAVALHNIRKDIWDEIPENKIIAEKNFLLTINDFRINHEISPLAFLLILVDTLQDWDRPLFVPSSSEELRGYQTDQDISITLDDNHVYLAFPNKSNCDTDPYKTLLKSLKETLMPYFIDDLLREIPWRAVNARFLTEEAQQIEMSSAKISDIVSTSELKTYILDRRKRVDFEYRGHVDFLEEQDILPLVRDFLALANTDGGYYVIGLNENPFVISGITEKTKLPDHEDLIQIVNLFYSSPINFFSGTQKMKFTEDSKVQMKTFYVFYVEKSSKLIALIKRGHLKDSDIKIFDKYEVPIRQNALTVSASEEYINNRCEEAKSNNDLTMLNSIHNILKYKKIPSKINQNALPGDIPAPDFDRLIGREENIKELLEFLDNPKKFSITIDGIGGSGKSALAMEVLQQIQNGTYTNEYNKFRLKTQFDGVVWVSAKTLEFSPKGFVPKFGSTITLDILLDKISETINLPEIKSLDFKDKVENIVYFLSGINCLIVIDNLETISDTHKEEIINFVENDLPKPSKIIFTTRTKFHAGYSIRVMELKPNDAEELVKDIAIDFGNYALAQNKTIINKILGRTGRIPLGIKWLTSRICLGFYDIKALPDKMDDIALLRFCFEETFNILSEAEKNILFAISLSSFVPDIEHIEFVTNTPKTELTRLIDRLEAFSLIKRQVDKLTMLPLTKEYSIYNLQKIPDLLKIFHSKMQELIQYDEAIFRNLPVKKKMAMKLFHVAAMESGEGNYLNALEHLEKARSYSKEAYILKAKAEILEKRKGIEEAIQLYIDYANQIKDDQEVLFKIGNYFRLTENFSLALKYFKILTQIDEMNTQAWHFRGLTEKSLVFTYRKDTVIGKNYLNEAINSFQKALKKPSTTQYEQHLNTINYSLLAKCYSQKNDIKKACEMCLNGLKENPKDRQLQELSINLNCATEEEIKRLILSLK